MDSPNQRPHKSFRKEFKAGAGGGVISVGTVFQEGDSKCETSPNFKM